MTFSDVGRRNAEALVPTFVRDLLSAFIIGLSVKWALLLHGGKLSAFLLINVDEPLGSQVTRASDSGVFQQWAYRIDAAVKELAV
jgi:hypothetical protein